MSDDFPSDKNMVGIYHFFLISSYVLIIHIVDQSCYYHKSFHTVASVRWW